MALILLRAPISFTVVHFSASAHHYTHFPSIPQASRNRRIIGELPKLCVKIRHDSDDDNEMGNRPISYQDEFSRII